jgi:FkbH-like protein
VKVLADIGRRRRSVKAQHPGLVPGREVILVSVGMTTADSSADALVELSRAGRLVAEYPLVRELVSGLSGPALLRAGRLLARLDPDEILREHATVSSVTIAITGHGTLGAVVPALTAELARYGLVLRPVLGDFESYVMDLGSPSSKLRAAGADLVLCVLDPAVIFDEVPVPWGPEDVERVAAAKLLLIGQLAAQLETAGQGTLVLNTMPLLRRYAGQLVDSRSRACLGAVWREANARLLRLAQDHPGVVVLDLEPLIADGVAVSDARLSTYVKAHLTADLLAGYAREVGHLARHLSGLTRKCLVLDLDNTLWGGVLGDDGVEGIEVGDSYRGEAFLAFQRVVKQIGSQGVLIAAVSKNDPELVRQVLREHPRMALRESDFASIIANWQPKHDNLIALARTLGLAAESFVFVDDSEYERGLVRRQLPGVAVVDVSDEPALHVEKLLRDGWFDVRELTPEDGARASMYREEVARKSFLDSFGSAEDYLRELGVSVALGRAAEPEIARLAQLTLRTNQFNLTTRRLQPADVRTMINDPATLVLSIRASDRFGDNGLVGAVFLRHSSDMVCIENFLLSCRVFSRGIEQACLAWVLRHARASGARAVSAIYRPGAKNHAVADFYPRYGFVPIAREGTAVTFCHCLAEIMPPPDHVGLSVGPALAAARFPPLSASQRKS